MRWVRRLALTGLVCLASLPGLAIAQTNPTLSEAERGIRAGDGDAPSENLRIATLAIDAHVVGRTADVTLDLRIEADSRGPYEATLALALPADAVVTGYALDAEGTLIPGQLLEQPKARNVYEDEVRAGIDPGLAEVRGNRFTTRIYPIDRAHARRFRVSFVTPFDPQQGLVLPLSRDAAIGTVALDLRIDGYAEAPAVRFAGTPVALERSGEGWQGRVASKQQVLRDGLAISGGMIAAPLAVTQHASGERFFLLDDAAPADRDRPRGRLRIYWDRSLSHGSEERALEAEALARLIDATRPSAIDLVSFASDRPRVATAQDAAGLRKALDALVYRGGTSLAGLDGVALPDAAACVLVSDGEVTIDRAAEFAPDCPLSVLTASPGADGPRLARVAQQGGGRVVRIGTGGAAQAAVALAAVGGDVTAVRDEAGQRLAYRVLPAGQGRSLLAGRMPDRGDLRVRFADGSERRYTAPDASIRADAAGALWAAQAVQALADDPARHAAMADLARRFQVAGPGMAFLVLERPDQYVRADIAPPAGFSKEWMAAYQAAKQNADSEAGDAKSKRFDFVLGEWQHRQLWWSNRFVARPRPKPRRERVESMTSEDVGALPAPAPAPASGYSAGGDAESEIVVTGERVSQRPRQESPNAPQTVSASAPPAVSPPPPGEALNRTVRPDGGRAIGVELKPLVGALPYIAALEAAVGESRHRVLAEQERAYGTLPSFYLDTAEWFRGKGDAETAALLLLSALELPLSDDETRQIVAFRLERDKAYDRAVELAEHLAAANAEFRPQPARSLALALAARGRSRGAAGRADLERAFTLLTDAALNPASSDFDGFEVIALMEANALIPDIRALGGRWSLDPRLVGLLDTDVRIVIEWTADDADIDLWVDEPGGERVFYSHKLSSAGGQISNDMTDGYGPEEYAIRRAPRGAYAVRINGFDADRINPNGPGHVLIRLVRNFARAGEAETMIDADLSFQKGMNRDALGKAKPVATLRVGE